jgi:ribosome biogenesis GTPase
VSLPDNLAELGYDDRIAALAAEHVAASLAIARVSRADRGYVFAIGATGLVVARPSTRLVKSAEDGAMPVVGDWIALSMDGTEPQVEAVLPRVSAIARRDPGRAARVQVLAANVDTVLITHPLSDPPNLGRIERELAMVWDSGARPVVVLTKSDLADDLESARAETEAVAPGADVLVTSAVTRAGLVELAEHLAPGKTIALIGPSGSGKSTLINTLAGEDLRETAEVRMTDHRGRHTTVARELVPLPGSGLVIDTPGLRAVGMWDSAQGLDVAFADIAALAEGCKFRDCSHGDEPGCAVTAAVEAGELPARRLESYRELQAEIHYVAEQHDVRLREERKRHDKQLARAIKRYYKSDGTS